MAINFDRECFFIAPIGEDDSPIRKRSDGVRDLVVREAAEAHDLDTRRADDVGEPGQITSQIVQHCLKARMVVADLTGGNPNVYYELSVRHGAQLPVVLIAETGTKLPFDVGQARVIFFEHSDLSSAREAREAVKEQIGAALEGGVPDNPIANGMRLAELMGGSGEERLQALVIERLESLGATTADIDARLRAAERRETIKKTLLRNRAMHATGDPSMYLYLQEHAHRKLDEDAKDAAEAGLSPGAYLDDEIIEQDDEPKDPPSDETPA